LSLYRQDGARLMAVLTRVTAPASATRGERGDDSGDSGPA